MSQKIPMKVQEEVRELYADGASYKEIEELTGVKHGSIAVIAKRYGLDRRQTHSKPANERVCPNCKKRSPKEARYCMHCGRDIRSKNELILARCESIMKNVACLPEHVRSETTADMREIMAYLKEVK